MWARKVCLHHQPERGRKLRKHICSNGFTSQPSADRKNNVWFARELGILGKTLVRKEMKQSVPQFIWDLISHSEQPHYSRALFQNFATLPAVFIFAANLLLSHFVQKQQLTRILLKTLAASNFYTSPRSRVKVSRRKLENCFSLSLPKVVGTKTRFCSWYINS